MSYLFISFADRLDRDINVKNELFGESLRSQFNNLQKRIPLRKQINDFQTFIETCFPTILLNSVLFPTLGLPTKATVGNFIVSPPIHTYYNI